MQFTIEELRMIHAALGGYEDTCNCGDDDAYWSVVLTLRTRVAAMAHIEDDEDCEHVWKHDESYDEFRCELCGEVKS